ncbi:MAG TPA: ACT domain-containing protein [Syntrophomonadaceae bacterium]|nr:ACT domain-containing protein [Syntrophomonadaceae bacterium]HQE22575.1 ACT domain-containing protein [Syntrophomonadaceae bacterium]
MEEGKRVIITVLGLDRVGIIAAIANILAEAGVNILDISQTIVQEFFTMVMVVDTSHSKVELGILRDMLTGKGKELGLQVTVQHEDIFNFMHRI